MNKLTSEMKSTHKIWLGHRRINHLRPLARQTSSSPYIFACISKNRLGWIPVVLVYIACTGSYQATMGPVFISQHPIAMFDGISNSWETTASLSSTKLRQKNTIRRERGQGTRTGENRKLQLLHIYCLPEAVFYSVGRRDMFKLTSEMKPTHKIRLGNGRINHLRSLARQTSSSPYILHIFPKTCLAGFQSFLCISRVLGLIKPLWGRFSAHGTHVQCLTAYRTCVRSPHRSRTRN